MSDGLRLVVSQQMIVHFSTEMGTLFISLGQAVSYIRESNQLLRG
jgi:hypothetical protein